MKKIAIVIVLVIIAAVLIKQSKKDEAVSPMTVEQTPTTTQDPAYRRYSSEAQFEFTYPKDLIIVSNEKDIQNLVDPSLSWRNNTQTSGDRYVTVTIPRTFQPQTNFSEATFTIGMSTDYDAVRECIVPSNGERAKGSVEINGTTFYIITLSDAGMSNYYDTTSYRTLHNDSCYAVEYTIHSTSFAAYDPSLGIKEFDTPAVVKVLQDMVQSFKFI